VIGSVVVPPPAAGVPPPPPPPQAVSVAANSTASSGSDLRVEEASIKGVGIGVGFMSSAQKHLDAH